MTGGSPARQQAITTLVTAWQPDALAAVIVDALAVAGAQDEWDPDTIVQVVAVLESTTPTLPDTAPANTAYWRTVTGD